MIACLSLLLLAATPLLRLAPSPQQESETARLARRVDTLERENKTLVEENGALRQEVDRLSRELEAARQRLAGPTGGEPVVEDPYQPDRRWRGEAQDGNTKIVRLVQRVGDTVAFDAEGFAGGAVFRFSGKLTARGVRIDDIDRTVHPKGFGAVNMVDPRGTISIGPDGRLTMRCYAKMRSGRSSTSWVYECIRAEPWQ